ncbi:hypothetical protein IAQ61_008082, partial [Plenodomus lingam]
FKLLQKVRQPRTSVWCVAIRRRQQGLDPSESRDIFLRSVKSPHLPSHSRPSPRYNHASTVPDPNFSGDCSHPQPWRTLAAAPPHPQEAAASNLTMMAKHLERWSVTPQLLLSSTYCGMPPCHDVVNLSAAPRLKLLYQWIESTREQHSPDCSRPSGAASRASRYALIIQSVWASVITKAAVRSVLGVDCLAQLPVATRDGFEPISIYCDCSSGIYHSHPIGSRLTTLAAKEPTDYATALPARRTMYWTGQEAVELPWLIVGGVGAIGRNPAPA